MLLATGESRYADLLEQTLYNGFLSGISLDGQRYFYVNPLMSRGPDRIERLQGHRATRVVRLRLLSAQRHAPAGFAFPLLRVYRRDRHPDPPVRAGQSRSYAGIRRACEDDHAGQLPVGRIGQADSRRDQTATTGLFVRAYRLVRGGHMHDQRRILTASGRSRAMRCWPANGSPATSSSWICPCGRC